MSFRYLISRFAIWGVVVVALPFVVGTLFWPGLKTDQRLEDFYTIAPEIEALSLGASHTRAIHFPSMNISGYSFADDGGDIATAALKLRLLKDYTPKLRYVIVTLSPGYLGFDLKAAIRDNWRFRSKALRYAPMPAGLGVVEPSELLLLGRSHVMTFDKTLQINEVAKMAVGDLARRALYGTPNGRPFECRPPDNKPNHPDEDGIDGGFVRGAMPAICIQGHARAEAIRRAKTIAQSLDALPTAREMNIDYLRQMAELLAARNAELILVMSPVTKEFFEDETLQAFWRVERPMIDGLEALENVRIFDMHDHFYDRDYLSRNLWFTDGNHLNLVGAKDVSQRLGQLLLSQE